MKLQIISPGGVLLDTEADKVSVPGGAGGFTMLHNHAPIISTLAAGAVVYHDGSSSRSFDITRGIVRAKDNVIKIYV